MTDTAKVDTLLIDRAPGETRVAALSGETVIEVYHHRSGIPGAGAIYRGRVGKRLPDTSAVFVDIGLAAPAFMSCGTPPPDEGSVVDVRVVQPPRSTKGAKVARAESSLVEALDVDISSETKVPVCLAEAEHPVGMCARLYGGTLTRIVITPHDSDGVMRALLGPALEDRCEITPDDIFFDVGVDEAIEQALIPAAPFARVGTGRGGGKLIIEPTAALVAIDVDAGPLSAAHANVEAIKAVAREIRLRSLAGPMILDLIPSKGRTKLMDQLKMAVEGDPVATRVSGFTPEGRLEFNRRRIRPSLTETLLGSSGRPSVYAVAYRALRILVRQVTTENATSVTLKCHQRVAAVLRENIKPAFDEAENRVKCSIGLSVVADCDLSYIDILTA